MGDTDGNREMSQDGKDITAPTAMPAGGWGIRGWLSAAFTAFKAALDSTTEAIKTIDYAHHEIHEGNHFKSGYQDTSMAASDVINLLFVTPDTAVWGHWTLVGQSTGEAVIQVFEGTTVSGNGTAVARWNRNRNLAAVNESDILVFHTPTITGDGTKMSEKWIGGTGFKADVGGGTRGDSEYVLKQNTNYLVRLTAVGAGIKGAIGGDWYEHTSK